MKKKWAAFVVGAAVIAAGGYFAFDYYTGNRIALESVIPANANANASASGADSAGKETGASSVEAASLNGSWIIKQPESKVYVSVTTSKETVNIELGSVEGSWTLDTGTAAGMTAEAKVALDELTSGNSMRDSHIKEERFLHVASYPEASFELTGFENFPGEWIEGETVAFDMRGTMTVKGISKEVTFTNQAVYSQGTIRVEGSAVVTFDDFGMTNPHAVVLDTENNVTVQTRLVLEKA